VSRVDTLAWLRACAIVGVYVIGVIGIIDIPTYVPPPQPARADKGSRGREEASSPESRIRAFGVGVGRVSRAASERASERVGTAAQRSPTYPTRLVASCAACL
jgi:hypothetical protein